MFSHIQPPVMLAQIIQPLLLFTISLLICWICSRILFHAQYTKHFPTVRQELLFVSFVLYIGWMFCVTLYPTPMTFYKTPGSGSINLLPLITTYKQFSIAFSLQPVYARPFLHFLLESTIGNVILFAPFGFLVPQLSGDKTFKKTLVAALLLSCSIETLQFFLRFINIYRSVDVDDVILNVTGAALGFIALIVFRRLKNNL